MKSWLAIFFTLVIFILGAASASSVPKGGVTAFISPGGGAEHCVILGEMPGAVYSRQDKIQEKTFCQIEFYAGSHALCPKLFSTSPGTLIYEISAGEFAGQSQKFEAVECASSTPRKKGATGDPVSYKMTVNGRHTSATFSTASLLYYHFSRYLDASIHVPVSVYRSIDKNEHYERVIQRGLEVSANRRGSAMNHGGWEILQSAVKDSANFHPANELLTPQRDQLYGILLHPEGRRYSAELNGSRTSGWGKGENRDFQETAPFLALRSEKPLQQAIDEGIHRAAESEVLRKAVRHGVAHEQMVFWMQELTEITFLDYIFSQQDRIGNIDYLSYWYWVEKGEIKRVRASGTKPPPEIANHYPVHIRRTQLNDNDAGGRVAYANFTRQTEMLEKIRHFNVKTYTLIIQLAADFSHRGELYNYAKGTFGLSKQQLGQLVENTASAARILRENCRAKKLKFDLNVDTYLLTGVAPELRPDCDKPRLQRDVPPV